MHTESGRRKLTVEGRSLVMGMLRAKNALAIEDSIARAPRSHQDKRGRTWRIGAIAGKIVRQLVFWDGKGQLADFWIHKTVREWREEIGCTSSELKTATRVLTDEGLLETKPGYRPSDHRQTTFYRLNLWAAAQMVAPAELEHLEPELKHLDDDFAEDTYEEEDYCPYGCECVECAAYCCDGDFCDGCEDCMGPVTEAAEGCVPGEEPPFTDADAPAEKPEEEWSDGFEDFEAEDREGGQTTQVRDSIYTPIPPNLGGNPMQFTPSTEEYPQSTTGGNSRRVPLAEAVASLGEATAPTTDSDFTQVGAIVTHRLEELWAQRNKALEETRARQEGGSA